MLSLGTGMAVYGSGVTEEAAQVRVEAGVNPVTQPVRFGGELHPANRGFLVVVEGDITLAANESEGTMAAGGNLVIRANNYQVAIHPPAPTFKAEGDSGYTYLFVGGGVVWDNPNSEVRIENQGFTKIAGHLDVHGPRQGLQRGDTALPDREEGREVREPAADRGTLQGPERRVGGDAGASQRDRHTLRRSSPTGTRRPGWAAAPRR